MSSSRIPFKRVNEAFDELARARLCESSSGSGSEHSPSSSASAELSDLVNSFIEDDDDRSKVEDDQERDYYGSDSETSFTTSSSHDGIHDEAKELLKSLLQSGGVLDDVKTMIIQSETELARSVSSSQQQQQQQQQQEGFKRELMRRLREQGVDAGLCKSRWKRSGNFPAGDYEYIDVMVKGNHRYIVEVNLAAEFTIARPTSHYQSLLHVFPHIYVGEPDDLKQVVKLMSTAAKKSMNKTEMHVPPWRRNGYLLAKWFGSYKRTTNALLNNVADFGCNRPSVGFEMSPAVFQFCRVEVGRKVDFRLGNLAQLLHGTNCN